MDYVQYIRDRVGHDVINLTGVDVLIINENNEVLLQRRCTFPYKWGLVGGITELGESLEDTAIRETKEETGLDIQDLTLFGTTSGAGSHIEFPNGDEVYFISMGYYTRTYSGELKIDNIETKELRFFNFEELPDNIPDTHKIMLVKFYNKYRKKI